MSAKEPKVGIYAPELLNKVHDQFKMVKLNSDSPLTYGEWSLQNKWKCNSARYNKDGTSHRAGSTARDGITCSYKNSQVKPDDSGEKADEITKTPAQYRSQTRPLWKKPSWPRCPPESYHQQQASLDELTLLKPIISSKNVRNKKDADDAHRTGSGGDVDRPQQMTGNRLPNETPRCGVTLPSWSNAHISKQHFLRSLAAPRLCQSNRSHHRPHPDNYTPTPDRASAPDLTCDATEVASPPPVHTLNYSGLKIEAKEMLPQRKPNYFKNLSSGVSGGSGSSTRVNVADYPDAPPTSRRQSRNHRSGSQPSSRTKYLYASPLSFGAETPGNRELVTGDHGNDEEDITGGMLAHLSHDYHRNKSDRTIIASRKVMQWLGEGCSSADDSLPVPLPTEESAGSFQDE